MKLHNMISKVCLHCAVCLYFLFTLLCCLFTDLTRERDQLAEKNARISHEYTLQSKAMGNLNSALEGFQNQKENEMKWAEKDFDDRYACNLLILRNFNIF